MLKIFRQQPRTACRESRLNNERIPERKLESSLKLDRLKDHPAIDLDRRKTPLQYPHSQKSLACRQRFGELPGNRDPELLENLSADDEIGAH